MFDFLRSMFTLSFMQTVLTFFEVFFIVYLVGYSSFLFTSVIVGGNEIFEGTKKRRLRNEIHHDYYVPISVVVPAYNEEVTIVETIRSLMNLDYRIYEIIVVNDGSKDSTGDLVAEPFHLRHAVTVERVMGWYARELGYGEEADFWSIVGLLHDLDFEMWPEEHCEKSQELMRQAGVEESIVRATASHGYGLCCDIEPQSQMERVLFTIDELSGLITAAALMRPSHSVMDMELKSVKKKFKDKRFAAGVNREVILQGAERLGMDLDTVITETIKGMQEVAEAIGLGMAQ